MPRYESRVGRIECDITTFWLLGRMSWIATKLYNTALWTAKDVWDKTGKIPSGFDLQKTVLASGYHVLLPAHTYQHPAHQVGNAFRSWYTLRKKDERGTSKGRCSLCGCMDRKKIHRVHRGLFLCQNCNTEQNADVNGVGNQLVRYLRLDALPFISSSGCLAQPSVYRWDDNSWRAI